MRFQKRKCGSFFVKSEKMDQKCPKFWPKRLLSWGISLDGMTTIKQIAKIREESVEVYFSNKEEGTRSVPNFDPVRVGALSQNLGQMIDGSHFGTKLDKVYDLPTIAWIEMALQDMYVLYSPNHLPHVHISLHVVCIHISFHSLLELLEFLRNSFSSFFRR